MKYMYLNENLASVLKYKIYINFEDSMQKIHKIFQFLY